MGGDVRLRDLTRDDLPDIFEQQLDVEANRMAAFTVEDPADRDAFRKRWKKLMQDRSIVKKAVLSEGRLAGYVVAFTFLGERTVGYWLGKAYWGRGIASSALADFVSLLAERPLYARVAKDNAGSIRVLEKSGFAVVGEDKGFSYARREEVEEFVYKLE